MFNIRSAKICLLIKNAIYFYFTDKNENELKILRKILCFLKNFKIELDIFPIKNYLKILYKSGLKTPKYFISIKNRFFFVNLLHFFILTMASKSVDRLI